MFLRHLELSSLLTEYFICRARCARAQPFHRKFCVKRKTSLDNSFLDQISSYDPTKVLLRLNTNEEAINGSIIISALSDLRKSYRKYPPDEPVKMNHFDEFFSVLEQHIEKLSAHEAINICNTLKLLKMPKSLPVFSSLVDHILHHVDNLSVQDCINFATAIETPPASNQTEHLQKRVQSALAQKLIEKLAVDHEDNDLRIEIEYLIKALHLASKFLDHSVYYGVIETLMEKLQSTPELIQIDHIQSILISLSYINYNSCKWQHLFLRIQNDLIKQVHLVDRVQMKRLCGSLDSTSLTILSGLQKYRLSNLRNKKLIPALIQRAIDDDMGFDVAQPLSILATRAGHKDRKLLDYASVEIFKSNSQGVGTNKIKTDQFQVLIKVLSESRYPSIAWDDLKDYVTKTREILNLDYDKLIRVTVRFMSLDWYPTNLLEKVFDGCFTCPTSSSISYSFLRIYQKIKSDPLYDGPNPTNDQIVGMTLFAEEYQLSKNTSPIFHKHLEEVTKNPLSIRTSIRTKLFHLIDGTPATITDKASGVGIPGASEYLENLRVPDDCHMILIQFQPSHRFFEETNELFGEYYMDVQTLQALYNCLVLAIDEDAWENLPDNEKTSFLKNEICSKLKSAHPANEPSILQNYAKDQLSMEYIPPDRDQLSSIEKIEMRRHLGTKLMSIIMDLDDKYVEYPSKEGFSSLRQLLSQLSEQTYVVSGREVLKLIRIIFRFPECSTELSLLLNEIAQCIDDLSIKDFLRLCYAMNTNNVDKTVKDRVLHTIAQNITENLSLGPKLDDIEYLRVALQIVTMFLDQRKYYELIKILTKRIYNYHDTIPIDHATSALIALRSFKYRPPRWKSLVRRIQDDVAKQFVLINEDRMKRLTFVPKEALFTGLDDYYNEEFLENVLIKPTISNKLNWHTSLTVLTQLLILRYKSHELLEYCSNTFASKFIRKNYLTLKDVRDVKYFIDQLSKARHHPVLLGEIEKFASRLSHENTFNLNQIVTVARLLLNLNCYPIDMLKKIFDTRLDCLEKIDYSSRDFLRIYQKLKSDPSYQGPMPTDLQLSKLSRLSQQISQSSEFNTYRLLDYLHEGIGSLAGTIVDVRTRLFHQIHYVVALHEDGTPAALEIDTSDADKLKRYIYLEDLRLPSGGQLVLIQSTKSLWYWKNTNELMGENLMDVESLENFYKYPVVTVNVREIDKLEVGERASFLMGKINAKLRSHHRMEQRQ
ncbi:hypothetical protein QAD02_005472 [Eretmocerus hayati]|uniref:Uncharacterized protein n=1 Tax=Eretmocerus hayati TaxID=131215 RepID=A0ACC2NSM8_9HYME|nr:hypothetical protein QAD02_005472 [Eretmocerus hayati]